jgi:hypothetical protein
MAFNGLKNVTDMTLPFIGRERGNQLTVEALFGFIFGDYGAGWGINHGAGAIDDLMKAEIANAKIQDADGDESTNDLQGRYYIPLTLRNVVITDETIIGLGSFWNCDMLTSLTIQSTVKDAVLDTVTQVKPGALKGCSNLVSLSIPFVGASDSISGGHLGYIFGTVTFDKAVQVQGTSYFIPSTLKTVELSHATTVKTHSFYYVKTVTKFVIGAKTRTMERSVFTGNSGMRELSIPFIGRERGIVHDHPYSYYWDRWHKDTIRNSVLWLFEYASADEMYVNYYITSSTWYPGDYAGYLPVSLKTINVTNDTYIPYAAFWGFSSLTDINILDQDHILEHIDGTIMKGCSNLENIQAPFIGQDANPYSYNNTNYVLGYWFGADAYSNSYAAYQNGATFYIPKTLTRVNFEDRMSTLANYVFANAKSVRAIHSQAPIRQLGAYAFANCTSLTELSLKNAIYTIVGSGAFMNDKALGEMTSFITQLTDDTDNLITRVNDYAFYGTAVTELHLKNYSYVGDYAFAKCLELKKVDFTGTFYTYVGKHLFDGCSHLTDITLTTYANDYMFANCTALEDIELDFLTQNNGGYIPAGFLYNCYNLKDGTSSGSSAIGGLPTAIMYSGLGLSPLTSGVKEIGEYAFAGCKNLTNFVLPETLEKIGDGAFQNCTGLSMLRIPRNTIKMSPGSKILDSGDIQDLTSTGIFYGCNQDFYLQVFYPEVDWPSGWGYNWNCYYPVYIIGDSTENWFTYEYSPEYKGYLITGLNIFSADNPEGYSFSDFFNDYDSATSEYLSPVLSGTVVFPNTHDGLFVFGIKENAFVDQQSGSILRNVDNYVLPQNCRHLGSDCLNILDYYTTPTRFGKAKLITIFSNRTSANAQTYPQMHYGSEGFYTERATIAYKEAWTYVATRPTIYMSAVAATLDSSSYIYDLGSAIEPDIISLTKNSTSVRYAETDSIAESNLDDLVKNAFHNVSAGTYQDVNLSSISVTYSDNINVGTGHVYIKSNDSRFTGTLDVSFRIDPYQVDLFNESDIYKDKYESFYERYIDYVYDAVADDQDPLLHPEAASLIYHKEFNGKYWTWSNWTQGSTAYGLPDGYSLTGTLRTTDFQAGFYGMYQKTDPTTGVITNPTMAGVLVDYANNPISPIGGFEWSGSPHVWNSSGKDVTYNFKFVITNLVEIKPFEIDSTNITWDGQYNPVSGYYEYEYAGGPIVPVPTVKNEDYVVLPLNAVIKVTPTEAIYPSVNVYYARIDSFDSRNFKFLNPADRTIQFIIKNRKLTISMDAVYTLKESDNYFEFSDWANSSNYPEYKIRIIGLNNTSSIIGNVVTDDWHEGLYSNNNTGTFTFGWDINGYRIKSSTLFETDGVTPKDETSYYDLTLNINVRIKYMNFDYELCIDTTTVGTYADSTLAKTIGVNSYLYSADGTTLDIEYGADGYTHELLAWVKNTTGANIEFEWKDSLDNSHSANTMNFKEIWNYEVILNIKKDKFYDAQLKINLNVVKGDYKFDDLTKEYDRNPVDPIAKLLRKPIDFKPDYLTFAYYNASGSALTSAPSQIGSYKVIINTLPGHSEWFNDLNDLTISFQITKRSIIIETVDDIPPIDSKVYDGSPWERRFIKSTDPSLNLLPGDMLTGVFLSKRATIGTYSSSVPNDFIASSFRVDNDTLNEQTGYYRIVFKGDYSILPREIKYTKSGVTKVYDGLYSWIDVQVQDPTTGYKIYYSEVSITTEDMDTDESKWVEGYPYTYNEPGVYTVYFKIVADTYKTVYDYEVVTITGKDVVYTASDVYVNYDGFEHGIEVTGLSPWNAIVKYAIIDPLTFDGSFESLNFSTVMPKFIGNEYGPTEYSYAIEVSAPNYNTK